MPITFITGNAMKFGEVKAIVPDLVQRDVDLPEIQAMDPEAIVAVKIEAARALGVQAPFIVEDTSLHFEAMSGLPGPFIKFFLQKIGCLGLYEIVRDLKNERATARATIGYCGADGAIKYFIGEVHGRLVQPEAGDEWHKSWDAVFMPADHDETFLAMGTERKNAISHRRKAVEQLATFLNSQDVQ